METWFVDNDGMRLAAHEFGGEGDVVLVAHATGFLGPAYRALAEELTDAFRVVALDFRGHGRSDTPESDEGFEWTRMASDVAAVIDAMGVDRVHGVGHSMGGAALMGAEADTPDRLASAFLFEPIIAPGGEFPGNSTLEEITRMRRRVFASRGEALERYAARRPLGVLRADVLHDYVTHGFRDLDDGTVTLRCTPESEATTFSKGGSIDKQTVAPIRTPVVVAASGDGGLPAQLAPAISGWIPNAHLEVFDHLTHFGPLQEPASVAAAVRRHIVAVGDS